MHIHKSQLPDLTLIDVIISRSLPVCAGPARGSVGEEEEEEAGGRRKRLPTCQTQFWWERPAGCSGLCQAPHSPQPKCPSQPGIRQEKALRAGKQQ